MIPVHIKDGFDVWGARSGKYPNFKHLLNSKPLELGWLGNPYVIGVDGNRNDVISKYKLDFVEKLRDEEFKKAVLTLKGKRVGCFCKPQECHLDVIAAFIKHETE